MKQFAIIAITLVVAYFAYQYLSKPTQSHDASTADSSPSFTLSAAPDNAAVFILEPGDGARVSSPLKVRFGITNMKVVPAGDNQENSGHHHLLINMETLPDMSKPLPASENLIHFGKGQTETTIELPAGKHSLQLLLGNYLHIPHKEPVISKKISITVIE